MVTNNFINRVGPSFITTLMERTGQTVITAEEALHYGIKDAGGKQPGSHRAALGDPRIPHPAIVR